MRAWTFAYRVGVMSYYKDYNVERFDLGEREAVVDHTHADFRGIYTRHKTNVRVPNFYSTKPAISTRTDSCTCTCSL